MRSMPTAASFAAALLLLAGVARAAPPPADPPPSFSADMQRATELLRQGLDKALSSVGTLLRAVPQYELPQMDANGDITIRRKRPSVPPLDPDDQAI